MVQMRISLFSWLFLMPICLLSISFNISAVSGECLGNQQSLLLQLKNSLVFDSASSTKLVHWNQSVDCCSWEGVTCNEGLVIGLDLTNDSISGGLDNSSSLFGLQYLQNLNLAHNYFGNSEIPSEFDKLSNLIYLNLSYAGFAGQIPIAILRLKRLVTLDLTYGSGLKLENPNLNMLVQNLSELMELYLDGIDLSMEGYEWGPTISSSLPKLRALSLSSCYLSGPLDSSLANLQSLSYIRMSDNNFSAPVPEFVADFKNLTTLILINSGLNGKFPEKIFQIPTLQTVDLSKNELEGFLPQFPTNGSLQTLVLKYTKFARTLPYSIGNLKMLSEIDLSNCNFSGQIPKSVANLTELFYLDMSFNRFNGSIPSFSMSKNLTKINLSNNDLTGQITSTRWEELLNLEVLELSYNSLEGSIPISLFSLPSLQELLLHNNRFSGPLNEFSTVPSYLLGFLDLSHNNLEGPIPISLFKLRALKALDLSSNKFNGSWEFSAVQKLIDLYYLDLSYNNLLIEYNETNSSLSSFPQFYTLRFASNNLKRFPDCLRNQSHLDDLDLSDNQIHGEIPYWIWKLYIPFVLNLSNNYFVTLEVPILNMSFTRVVDLSSNLLQGQLPILPWVASYLDLSKNNFDFIIPANIVDSIASTHFLSLSSNKLHGSVPESICNATALSVLDLSDNFLTGTVPKCLIEMSKTGWEWNGIILGVLNLRRNNFTGIISDSFPSDCGFQALDLSENKLEGKLPKSLAKCKQLEFLNIRNNNIEDVFPCHLKNMSILRVLSLGSNKFNGPIDCLESNTTWPMLQIIDLASNNFSGKLTEKSLGILKALMANEDEAPLELIHQNFQFYRDYPIYYQDQLTITVKGLSVNLVKILTIFTSLDLSCNNFDGPIPEEIGELKSLYILNLSHNAFTGQIPQSLGKLRHLESLDLSSNELTGEIPVQLADGLIFLSLLNLSFNKLVGKIPHVKQFATFLETAYEGNAGLCDYPLKERCTSKGSGSPVPTSEESDSNSGTAIDWNFLSAELGFVFGLGIIVGPLMFWKRWRICYYKHADDILFKILPQLYIRIENSRRQAHKNQGRRAHKNQGWRH